ncbi:MAG TPA: hypothetical protein VF258_03805, partial [Luteolibacter sp.]
PLIAVTSENEERPHEQATANGWFSAVILLVVTGGLVLAAIKGYAYLEARLDKEPKRNEETRESDKSPASPPYQKPAEAPEPVVKKPEDELTQPPPRAIIVR